MVVCSICIYLMDYPPNAADVSIIVGDTSGPQWHLNALITGTLTRGRCRGEPRTVFLTESLDSYLWDRRCKVRVSL